MARITELYKNPDLIIPQNTVAHYSANTWIAHTPQGEIYFLDFSGTVLTPEEDDTAEEAFRLYDRECRVIQNRAMLGAPLPPQIIQSGANFQYFPAQVIFVP